MKKLLIVLISLFIVSFFCFGQSDSDQPEEKAESSTVEKESELKGFNLEGLSEEQLEMLKNIISENRMKFCITKPISEFIEEGPQNLLATQLTQNTINKIKEGSNKREIVLQLKRYIRASKATPDKNTSIIYDINIKDSPYRGPEDAKVTIVEFSDFQCPYCIKLYKVLDQLEEKYPDDIKHVFKHFPLRMHKQARLAAKAALAAGEQGKFWEMREKLYDNSRSINLDNIMKFATELELDIEQFKKSLNDSKYERMISEDLIDGELVDVRGTPSIYINGRIYVGKRSVEGFEAHIKNIPGMEVEAKTPIDTKEIIGKEAEAKTQ